MSISGMQPFLAGPVRSVSSVFLSGVQLISIGILGEYLGKTYMEVKKRPRYIISERTGGKEEGPV